MTSNIGLIMILLNLFLLRNPDVFILYCLMILNHPWQYVKILLYNLMLPASVTIVATDVDGGSTDNVGIVSYSIDIDTFSCAEVGTNTVTLTVTDAAGNSDTCTATVTVEDNIAPTAVCQNITLQLDATGNIVLDPASLDGGSSDNCAGSPSFDNSFSI